jgi:F-type H+-transporting ATPase subunit delta
MRGASRASLAAAKERLVAALASGAASDGASSGGTPASGPGSADAALGARIGDDLFAVTSLLDRDTALCRSLSDPSMPASHKAGLVRVLLTGRIGDVAVDQVAALVSDRWSESGDLADATEQLAVLAIADAADGRGQLDELEDQLFRFGRVVQANPRLRAALSNQFLPAERKRELLSELVGRQVTGSALRLMTQVAVQPRGRSLDAALGAYANLAADLRQRLLAEVYVAIPLTDEQRGRLAAALAAVYSHDVHLNIVVDPEIVGGISVRIGDELINGSMASRLAELRRGLAS